MIERSTPTEPRLWRIGLCAAALATSALALCMATTANGQPHANGGIRTDSLADAVPAGVGFFIELDRLAPDKDSERAVTANRLYELLIGSHDDRFGVSTDWRRIISGLGIKPGKAAKALFSHRIAVAAPSWRRLAEGIVLVRLRGDDDLIRDTFPPDSMDVIDGAKGTIVYRTRTVLSAALDGKTLILSQRRTRDSLYHRAVQLMKDDTHPSLADNPRFEQSLRAAGGDPDGWVYLDASEHETSAHAIFNLRPSPVAVAVNLGANGVKFSVQASVKPPVDTRARRSVTLDRVKPLPQTTVAAWATNIDIRKAYRALVARSAEGDAPGWVAHLADVYDVETIADSLFDDLGPGALVVWDQHLGDGPDTPQIALIFESDDSTACADVCADIIQAIVDWTDLKKPAAERELRLSRTEYLGTPIHEIVWTAHADRDKGVGETSIIDHPTFAAIEGAFVLATGPDQIRNIIDARLGLAPKLGDLAAIKSFNTGDDRTLTAAICQPALAAQVVDGWLSDPDRTLRRWVDSLLSPDHGAATRAPTRARLGIGVQPDGRPGGVTVARVNPGGRADGHLQLHDRILGVNDTLLSLSDPAGDLRKRVATAPPGGHWVFRIQRGDEVLNAVVPSAPPRRVAQAVTDPAGALRQLQSLFELVDFASVRVTQPAPDKINARVALRFAARLRSDPTPPLPNTPPTP